MTTTGKVIFLESKGTTRESGRFDSSSIRAGGDVTGYLILPIRPMIQVQRYEDISITCQLNGKEGIKTTHQIL